MTRSLFEGKASLHDLRILLEGSRECGVQREGTVTAATWPVAWTPRSVRPDPITARRAPVSRSTAASSSPWTVRSWRWDCQPKKALPS